MPRIYFVICILFFLSTISTQFAPPIVYSATIFNKQNSPIQCTIFWLQRSGDILQSDLFQIEPDDDYKANAISSNIGGLETRAIINEIRCGDLSLIAPFDGVESPSRDWIFAVQSNEILSLNPNNVIWR
jgi:hypothetical protein